MTQLPVHGRSMGEGLQQLFETELKKALYDRAVALIEAKIENEGASVSRRDRRKLLRALKDGNVESLRLGDWRWWDKREIAIQITDDDLEVLEQEASALFDSLPEMVPRLVEDVTPTIVRWIDRTGAKTARKQRRELRRFERRLEATWREPFELLDLAIHIASQVGHDVAPALAEELQAEELTSVIFRLHGRGLRVAREVLTLLRAGFADAALARWRTLHEITVVASFVSDHGEPCAKRYVSHQSVANYKGALKYQESAERLGYQSFTEQEIAELAAARDRQVARFGKEFARDYGWATPFMDGAPSNFAEIEKAVSFDHLRPIYKWASQEVHAGAKSLFSDLAAPPQDVILIGPSNTGFADPGQNTCISLAALSTVLLQRGPTIDGLVTCSTLAQFVDRAVVSFVETQRAVEADSAGPAQD